MSATAHHAAAPITATAAPRSPAALAGPIAEADIPAPPVPTESSPLTIQRALLLLALCAAAFIYLFPFAWSILTSLKTVQESAQTATLWPKEWTLDGYRTAFSSLPFARYFFNSALLATALTVSNVVFSALGGYAFARLHFPFRNTLFALVLGSMMLPDQLRMVPVFRVVKGLGLVDTYAGVWLVGAVVPFGLFFMRQAFLTLPKELEEAARLDGAGHLKIFWRVMLPLTGPSLAALAILTFQGAWNEFFWPLILLHDESRHTLPVGLASFVSQYETQWPALMAATVVATLPVLIVYIAFQRYFVAGVTAGAVK